MGSRQHASGREKLVQRRPPVCGRRRRVGRWKPRSFYDEVSIIQLRDSGTQSPVPPPMNSSTQIAVKPITIAIVGRPNVGKSTLFNRLTGSRRAIVGDEPGITRDRLYGEGEWRGRPLRLVDTGGIIPDDADFIPAEIFRQAKVALDQAAAMVMVVDARTELAAPDLELARLLSGAVRRCSWPSTKSTRRSRER